MITISDAKIKEIARDLFGIHLNFVQLNVVKVMIKNGEWRKHFNKLPINKQEQIRNKYGDLLAKI